MAYNGVGGRSPQQLPEAEPLPAQSLCSQKLEASLERPEEGLIVPFSVVCKLLKRAF